jgi:hypothetical protein
MGMAQKTKLKLKILNSKLIKRLIFFVLIGVIFFNVVNTVYGLRDKYFSSDYWQRFPSLEKTYLDSQYINKNPPGWVPDQVIQSYAGGALIKGMNPIYVIPDTPPLGKYLIGLSALIFNNENTVILIFLLLSLVLMYKLSYQIFESKIMAIIPSFLLSFEPIFKNQLIYAPLLDIIQLVFLLFAFIFFNKALSSKKSLLFFLLANVFVGFFISTKFFITGIIIEAAFYFVIFIRKDKKRFFELTLTVPVAVIILLLSYIRVLILGYPIHKFLGIQKWIFLYHKSQLILPFSIWPLMLLNKWYVWYGSKPVISDPQWLITWPIMTLLTIVTTIFGIIRTIKINENVLVLISWAILYFGFFSFGQISSRYFVILIPILYIISVYGVLEFVKKAVFNKKLHV